MGEEILKLKFTIQKMNIADLPAVASIHKKAWREDHFSSRLSLNQLKVYYSYLLKYNEYCFVAIVDNIPVGFVAGGSNTREAIKRFLNDNFFSMVLTLLKNPVFLYSRIKNYFKIISSSSSVKSLSRIRLLSIAVDPEVVSKGIATSLMKIMEESVRADRHQYLGLSVHKDNTRAIELYNRAGWRIEKQEGLTIYYILDLIK